MDPTQTLKEMTELADEIRVLCESDDGDLNQFVDAVESLTNYVTSLDEWMRNGGFLPDQWNKEKQ